MKKIKKIVTDITYYLGLLFLIFIMFDYTYNLYCIKEILIEDINGDYELLYKSRELINKSDGVEIDSIWYTVDVRIYYPEKKIYRTIVHKVK